MLRITITFEDHGQDFLRWVIQDGKVIECEPFQAGIWVGKEVISRRGSAKCRLMPGDKVYIRGDDGYPRSIKYPIECITYEKVVP